jgi:hypothetical protein
MAAYLLGCKGRNGAPKHALNVGRGSLMPVSVPATLAVYPEINWYMACPGDKRDIGGNTPNASQVRKKMFFGMPPTDGSTAFEIKCKG